MAKTWTQIDINTDLRKAKNDFEKFFSNWRIIQFLEKLWKCSKKKKDIKFVTTKKKKLFGVKTKLYYKVFHKKFIGAKNEKFKYQKNNLLYLGLSMLELIETLIYEFSYDYVKLNYGEKAKQCFMDTESSIVCII